MDNDKTESISRRAYELWEAEGHPHGRHEDHWHAAAQELAGDDASEAAPPTQAADLHPGMMGDGTEEQNLGQPGNPDARITEDEVKEAFADLKGDV